MTGERVSINGIVGDFADFAPDEVLAANFVYQKIAVFSRRVMRSECVVEVVGATCEALYDCACDIDADSLSREIVALLDANDYPAAGGALVSFYVFPGSDGRAVRLLSCEKQLAWRDYAHTAGYNALIVPCEVPFANCRTASSLAAQTCAGFYARRMGHDAAICENSAGVLTTIGDAPLFAAAGDHVFAAPSADCVERRAGIAACRAAGLRLHEQGFSAADMPHLDEIFAFTPQGIMSISGLEGRSLPHSLAANLLSYIVIGD